MPRDVDLLILGGGCAGLSLAMQLAQRGQCAPSTLILEQRVRYENDRTWCFWGDDKTPFAQQAAHQWSTFKVAYSGTQQYWIALKRLTACSAPTSFTLPRRKHLQPFLKCS